MPTDPKLKENHEELLALSKKFHEVCVTNGINYSLHGGTLLGAVREKGFIPWDNDVDVSFMRTEYEKFRDVMLHQNPMEEIVFDDRHRVPRFIMKKSGAFLDIFIYDLTSENKLCQKVKTTCNMFLRALVEDKVNVEGAKKRNRYHRLLYWGYGFLQKIGGLLPQGYALKAFNNFNKSCLCGRGRMIFRSNDGYPGIILPIPAEAMAQYETAKFEDTELMISTRYRVILESIYGEDYMTPKRFGDEYIEAHEIMQQYIKEQLKTIE